MDKITKDIIAKLSNTDSINESNEIINAIEARTCYIIETLVNTFCESNKRYWWAWNYYEEDDSQPSFKLSSNIRRGQLIYSLNECKKMLFLDKDGNEWDLKDSCPDRWLWEEFEEELNKGKQAYRIREENRKACTRMRSKQLKEIKQQYVQSAKAKLTEEELWATGLSRKMPKALRKLQTKD